MAVISGFHVDEYCLPAFKSVVELLADRLAAQKITNFLDIAPGDFIARVPPKITSEKASQVLNRIPVYQIEAVGDDFDDEGKLVRTGQSDYVYFEAGTCYLLDLSSGEPEFEESAEPLVGAMGCFEAREIGRVKEKHQGIDEYLKGILYKIPADRIPPAQASPPVPG
jgi:hypothetical protein